MIEFTHKNSKITVGLIEEILLKAYWMKISKNVKKM